MLKGLLQSEQFYCNHLGASERDEQDIMAFEIRDNKGLGLLEYLQHIAFIDEESGTMRTYMVRDKDSSELVGYFSLKAGLISYNEHDEVILDETTGEKIIDEKTGEAKTHRVFDTLPGAELADFAVNQAYIKRHPELKGVGMVIYRKFILPIIRESAKHIGIKILYIFALPYEELISRYEKYGFTRLDEPYEAALHNRLKPDYDDSCVFMFRIL